MRISIVGMGHVGLVTAACLAEKGHAVACVDADPARLAAIEAARAPFHEPGLDALLRRHAGRLLSATVDLRAAVLGSELTFLAVGTPFDGRAIDLAQVRAATRGIGEALGGKDGYHVVAVRSTVVPGTTDGVVGPILAASSGRAIGAAIGLSMNPEFLSEGSAVRDFMAPDRIVLGGIDRRTQEVLGEVYRGFAGVPVLCTGNATAELVKYASNALLGTLISFANEIADLSESVPGVDAADVMAGVHLMRELQHRGADGRAVAAGINAFLHPGCGFGGSCLPKDIASLSAWAGERGRPARVLDAALAVNGARPLHLVEIVEAALGALDGKRIALLGLAFKPGTDDVRDSPALPIARALARRGAQVGAYDPLAASAGAAALAGTPGVAVRASLEAALEGIDAAILVTRWDEFRAVPALLAQRTPPPLLVDGRRMLDPRSHPRYVAIGLAPAADDPAG